MSAYILEMKNITKTFPGVIALNNVSLQVKRGEIHALVGENGAGKSTLMKVLNGVYQADSGEILIDGQSREDPGTRPTPSGSGSASCFRSAIWSIHFLFQKTCS